MMRPLLGALLALCSALPCAHAQAPAAETPKPDTADEIEARKSYSIPALDIVGFEILVNRYNRYFGPERFRNDYRVNSVSASLHAPQITCIDSAILAYGLLELLFSEIGRAHV